MLFQAVPAIDRDPVVPPGSELRQPTVLWLELDGSDLLEGVLLLVPFNADVLDWLLFEVLQHLRAEGVGDLVCHVEFASVLGDDVDWIVVFDVVFSNLLLSFPKGKDTVLGDVVSVAVGGLGILWHGDH